MAKKASRKPAPGSRRAGASARGARRVRLLDDASVRRFFAILAEAMPAPTTELAWRTPFELLVAVMLSAQTTDAAVNRCTPALFAAAPTPASMVALGEAGVRACIRTIGLYNTKARNVVATSALLLERHGGVVPADRAALEALPGVGRKTANVLLNTLWGEPTLAVDTHVFRVANRTRLVAGRTPRAVEDALLARIPAEYLPNAHHWLILHGRHTCLARRPRCPTCPVHDCCGWPERTKAEPALLESGASAEGLACTPPPVKPVATTSRSGSARQPVSRSRRSRRSSPT